MTDTDDGELARMVADSTIAAVAYEEALPRQLRDPSAVVKLIDRSLLVFDETGKPLNVLEALDTLLEDSPYLIGDPLADRAPRPLSRPIRAMRISSIPNPHDTGRAARQARIERSAR